MNRPLATLLLLALALPAGAQVVGITAKARKPGARIGALDRGLAWLAESQEEDGRWDAARHEGAAGQDVGVTALAVLAFLGNGHTTLVGDHRQTVLRGVKWLRGAQDAESGLFGDAASATFVHQHGLATLALCEAYDSSRSPLLRVTAERALAFVHAARNPDGGWRYAAPPDGESDAVVTGVMLEALLTAKRAGLEVDEGDLDGGFAWLASVTDAETGRVSYTDAGATATRPSDARFRVHSSEALTAMGLFLARDDAGAEQRIEVFRRLLPVWDPEGDGTDPLLWLYGARALYRAGDAPFAPWDAALRDAAARGQSKNGELRGSWDPIGPWGPTGGRVYTTAVVCLALEAAWHLPRD